MGKQSFIHGAMILLAAGIINRMLGFVPRIVLPRIIGAEGVGLYQMGYPLLIVLLTLITGGIPLAVAKLVAEAESRKDEQRIRVVLSAALLISTGLSFLFFVGILLSGEWIATHLFTDRRVHYTFIAMSPILILVALSSVYRGYFQGRHNMIPTASSQIAETLVRTVTALLLAYWLLPYGIHIAAAGAMSGVMLGEFFGLLVLLLHFKIHKTKELTEWSERFRTAGAIKPRSAIRQLLDISVPVTGSKLVGSGSYFLESIMIIQSLAAAGIATAVATAQYGALQGMVIPILLLPNALTYSLAISLIPSLSEAAARKDFRTIHKRLHQSLRLALVTGAPFAVIMFVLADPLCYFLYHDNEVGGMLKMMAPVALFIYFQGPLQAALQALDRPGTALLNTFVGASIKLVLIVLLATKPQFGIIGAVFAISMNIVLVTLLHWNSVSRLLNFSMRTSDFGKVGLGMLLMGAACYMIMHSPWTSQSFVRFAASCSGGLLLYLFLMMRFKLIDKFDLLRIPWIGKLIFKWL
ncbi:stage V sporulation protein B [Ferviditalea candida]|uniref:Stage V sporulation protein B n=1 Tax=Ferviditalea candida TaxID=3108399 RepID=A0ABU5ZLQ4_9BACL|nr:stage V sporulation protein B [Paenibacillaceae bacterium T2]